MTEEPKRGFISSLLGDVQVDTKVGFTSGDLVKIGLTLFVFASLIFLAWFTFKKVLK